MSIFYSEAILSRRGPLARVWLAAHYERKLSKAQTLQTDIGQSVGAIVGQEQVPMALRLSGQLLLGVVRIYSRKAKYLLDDCNEAIVKIKLAFRPGVVDMTEDQIAVNRSAITLDIEGFDAEFMPQNMDWDIPTGNKQNIARQKDITLANNAFMDFGFDDNAFDFNMDMQDWEVDPGLTFGDDESEHHGRGEGDDSISMEIGRRDDRRGSPRISVASNLRGDFDRDMSVFSKGADAFNEDFGAAAGAFDDNAFDVNFDAPDLTFEDAPPERQMTPAPAPAPSSRAATPQTPPAQTAPDSMPTPTPRTAARIAKMADQRDSTAKKVKKAKKQIVDSITELEDGPGAGNKRRGLGVWKDPDVSEITIGQRFLPGSRAVMALLEIQADPLSHFMPTKTTAQGSFFCAAPPSMTLAPELQAMFMFPIRDPKDLRRRPAAEDANPRSPKKARVANGKANDENAMDESVEIGRRAASEVQIDISGMDDYGAGADFTFDAGGAGPMDIDAPDIQLDITVEKDDDGIRRQKHRSVSRLVDDTRSTPGFAEGDDVGLDTYDAQSCTIGMFDMRSSKDSTQKETQSMREEAEDIDRSTERVQSKGYSKNTVKAIAVIKKGLETDTAGHGADSGDQFLSFNKIAQKASRRAASAFFFELLVLSTRDCVKVTQEKPFENIEIRAKEKLFESIPSATPVTV